MLNEIIEKNLSIREMIEIIKPLFFVLNDRVHRDFFIKKRFLVDDAEQKKKFEDKIRMFEGVEKDDLFNAEAALLKYDLEFDVDELLGTERW